MQFKLKHSAILTFSVLSCLTFQQAIAAEALPSFQFKGSPITFAANSTTSFGSSTEDATITNPALLNTDNNYGATLVFNAKNLTINQKRGVPIASTLASAPNSNYGFAGNVTLNADAITVEGPNPLDPNSAYDWHVSGNQFTVNAKTYTSNSQVAFLPNSPGTIYEFNAKLHIDLKRPLPPPLVYINVNQPGVVSTATFNYQGNSVVKAPVILEYQPNSQPVVYFTPADSKAQLQLEGYFKLDHLFTAGTPANYGFNLTINNTVPDPSIDVNNPTGGYWKGGVSNSGVMNGGTVMLTLQNHATFFAGDEFYNGMIYVQGVGAIVAPVKKNITGQTGTVLPSLSNLK